MMLLDGVYGALYWATVNNHPDVLEFLITNPFTKEKITVQVINATLTKATKFEKRQEIINLLKTFKKENFKQK